ncbi:MAG: phosphotransferase [Deltaproteobacteria bacterium]|nr:phosphotransferase [Deltaproteobacteria bacterium]
MAVYTVLPRALVNNMAAVFPEVSKGGDVVDVEGVPQGSINTTYRVTTADGSVWFLRVNENKSFEALLHERDVLAALAGVDVGVVTPRMVLSVPGGSFFPVDVGQPDGDTGRRWACWFPALPGRDLGVFEVTPAHTLQVGAALARCHKAMGGFRRRRRNPFGLPVVQGWLQDLHTLDVLPPVIERLKSTIAKVRRRRRLLPLGLVHGDLFIDNTKWADGRLRAIFDWEMAGRDHLALDVAIAVCAWSFARQGDTLGLVDDTAAALVEGYQEVRPFSPTEKRGFFSELVLAAVRFTTSRVRDFEVPRPGNAERRHLDYRDFLARLDVVESRGERSLRATLGLR